MTWDVSEHDGQAYDVGVDGAFHRVLVFFVGLVVLALVLLEQVVHHLEFLSVDEVVKHAVVRRSLQDVVLVGLLRVLYLLERGIREGLEPVVVLYVVLLTPDYFIFVDLAHRVPVIGEALAFDFVVLLLSDNHVEVEQIQN